jgi:hypothetical protein
MRGPFLIKGIRVCASYSNPFLISKEQEDEDHRSANDIVIEILAENPEPGECLDDDYRHELAACTRANRKLAGTDRAQLRANL